MGIEARSAAGDDAHRAVQFLAASADLVAERNAETEYRLAAPDIGQHGGLLPAA